ncbi:prephenate dehydrogenase [Heyndrickxia acidicola]|uniref:Prephenate dehydrogenase n=1 Tax=Heyndrickxia acidicola TaxID=209389 RepID=A0ABU6MJY7_9BACI|nr:prephenate dehydrogenase [Heyndrickxia acidicola]MED1205000.1 prephenate dehydrogenase [Heyndrickxia acidicola]
MQGNVFIVGLGLIGGSLALTIKRQHPKATIIGYDVKKNEMELAKILGVIDECSENFQSDAERADLVILAAPIIETEKWIERLALMNLKKDVLITDTGSTKKSVVDQAALLVEKDICFIGGHPMAGSHKSGVAAAKERLFENAFYILTPLHSEQSVEVDKLKKWLSGTHAKFITLSAKEHDGITGIISHFPHLIAASLVGQAKENQDKFPLLQRMAAGGFRDITRIASSSPVMWSDISLRNKEVLLELMDKWMEEMEKITALLHSEDYNGLHTFFSLAKEYRDQLPSSEPGAIRSFYDLFIDVPDYPGVISEITGHFADEKISITNIRILETREDIYGVLRVSFQTEEDRERAFHCLKQKTTYELYRD